MTLPPSPSWGHNFFREWSPRQLADYTVEFQRRHDHDFLKLNPRATHYYEAWGCTFDRPAEPRQPRMLSPALGSAAALAALPDVYTSSGPFGEQTNALRLVLAEIGDEVDVLQTVFSPLAVAGRLAGTEPGLLRRWTVDDAAAVHTGLATIARTLARHAAESIAAEARAALSQTGGRRHLVAAGCAISPLTPPENVDAVIAAVRG